MEIGVINKKVQKRVYSTPKEINQFLKDSKDGMSIGFIAERLGLPKTQVEHYFRLDKSRAIPSPDVWLRLKELLGFGSHYDKMVLEFYEKDMEYEMNRRVYGAEGECPTLKSGSSTCLVASVDSVTDSKRQIPISDVSGIATSTNTQSKPITRTSMNTMNHQTSGRLNQRTSQTLICSVEDSPASLSALLENARVSKILEVLYSLRYTVSPKPKDLDYYSSKMSKDSCQQTMEGVSVQSCHRWMNWGMTVNGRFLTANILECHRTGNVCSLSDILEEQVDSKYFLSNKQVQMMVKNSSMKVR